MHADWPTAPQLLCHLLSDVFTNVGAVSSPVLAFTFSQTFGPLGYAGATGTHSVPVALLAAGHLQATCQEAQLSAVWPSSVSPGSDPRSHSPVPAAPVRAPIAGCQQVVFPLLLSHGRSLFRCHHLRPFPSVPSKLLSLSPASLDRSRWFPCPPFAVSPLR